MTGLLQRLNDLEPRQRTYALETLAGHLADAGQPDRLQTLFADQEWMRARVSFSSHRYDGFLADLELAAQHALDRAGEGDDQLIHLFRLCLIRSSVTTRAEAVPAPLVREAVRRGRWSAARAISMARTRGSRADTTELAWELLSLPDLAHDDRRAMTELSRPLPLSPASRDEALAYWRRRRSELEAVRGQWSHPGDSDRAIDLLIEVRDCLTVTLRAGGVAYETPAPDAGGRNLSAAIEAERARLARDDPSSARELALARFHTLRMMAARAYLAIRTVPGYDDRVRREAEAIFEHALDPDKLTFGQPKPGAGEARLDAAAVERIALRLSPEQRTELVTAIQAEFGSATGRLSRARAFAALGMTPLGVAELGLTFQPQEGRPSARSRKSSSRGKSQAPGVRRSRSKAGGKLKFEAGLEPAEGIHLQFGSYVEEPLDLEMEYLPFDAAVRALADVLPQPLLVAALGAALAPLPDYKWISIGAVCALLPGLEVRDGDDLRPDLIARSLECIARLPAELQRWHWPELAPHLDDDQLERTLAPDVSSEDRLARIRLLAGAARRQIDVRDPTITAALDLADALADPADRKKAIAMIAPALTATTEPRAAELAFDFSFVGDQLDAVAEIAPHLSAPLRARVIGRAFAAAQEALPDNAQEDARFAIALARLLSNLDGEARRKAMSLSVAHAMDGQFIHEFKEAVKLVGPYATLDDIDRLDAFRWEMPEGLSAFVRASGAHLMTPAELGQLFDRIMKLDVGDRLEPLEALLAHADGPLGEAVADAAWQVAVSSAKTPALAKLVPRISAGLVATTFESVRTLGAESADVVATAITPRLAAAQLQTLLNGIAGLPDARRWLLLRDLAPHLPSPLREQALASALALVDTDQRCAASLPYLPARDPRAWALVAGKLYNTRINARDDVLGVMSSPDVLGVLSDAAVTATIDQLDEIVQWEWW